MCFATIIESVKELTISFCHSIFLSMPKWNTCNSKSFCLSWGFIVNCHCLFLSSSLDPLINPSHKIGQIVPWNKILVYNFVGNKLGRKQQSFTFWTVFALISTILITWGWTLTWRSWMLMWCFHMLLHNLKYIYIYT